MALLEQRSVPFGAPQKDGGEVSSQWRGWFDWVTKVCNAFLRGRFYQVAKIAGDRTMLEVDSALIVDATTGNVTITLLPTADAQGKRITVKKVDATANTVTVLGTIDGAVNLVLTTQYQSYDLVPDPDTNAWHIV